MRLVLDYRSSERSAVLIAGVVLLRNVTEFFRLGLRVQTVVAERREPAPVNIVGAALGDNVHHADIAAAVLRLVTLRDEIEFLDRLERIELKQAADGVVVVVAAVN